MSEIVCKIGFLGCKLWRDGRATFLYCLVVISHDRQLIFFFHDLHRGSSLVVYNGQSSIWIPRSGLLGQDFKSKRSRHWSRSLQFPFIQGGAQVELRFEDWRKEMFKSLPFTGQVSSKHFGFMYVLIEIECHNTWYNQLMRCNLVLLQVNSCS